MAGLSVEDCLIEITAKLTNATAVARAAVTCAQNGAERDAVQIAMDLDERVHEVLTLHGTMRLIARRAREAEPARTG